MKQREKYIDIKNLSDTKDYFNNVNTVYKDDMIKQGLFLLGELIADIQIAQTHLNIDYKIISSLDLNAVRKENVKSIIMHRVISKLQHLNMKNSILDRNDIQEKIALLSDRLVNIEESTLLYSDVSFHIMAGYSFRCMKNESIGC